MLLETDNLVSMFAIIMFKRITEKIIITWLAPTSDEKENNVAITNGERNAKVSHLPPFFENGMLVTRSNNKNRFA